MLLRKEGKGMSKKGQLYLNAYSWHLTFQGDNIVEVTALLDKYLLMDLLKQPLK